MKQGSKVVLVKAETEPCRSRVETDLLHVILQLEWIRPDKRMGTFRV